MSNPIVFRCVNLISDSVSGIPFKLYHKDAEGKDVHVEQAPVIDLLKKPNPFISQKDFFAQFVQFLEISGNVYIREVGPTTQKAPPKELYFIRPDLVDITNGDCGLDEICPEEFWGLVYEYRCGKAKERIDLRKLYHGKLFNPLCPFYGLSPLQACATSVDQLNEALLWNVSLLKNSAAPSLLLTSESTMSDDQIARVKEQMEVNDQGPWNSGRPVVASGDIKVERLGMSPKEMDWIEGIKLATKNITLTYGLDPSLTGDSDHRSFNTFKDAEKSFYIGTVLPILDKIRDDFLNRWLIPRFYGDDSGMFFEYDLNAIEVLAETRADVFKRLSEGVASGIISINEAREELGYSELPGESTLEKPDKDEVIEEI